MKRDLGLTLAGLAVAAVGIVVRFWQLAGSGWQYDEIVYTDVARSVATGHGLVEKYSVGLPHQAFLYQPPWYPCLLATWFKATGASITNARVLGVLLSGCTLVLLWDLIRRQLGPRAALFVILPLTFDGWLLYVERMSYIENLIIAVIAAGLVLYQRALDSPSWQRFAIAGVTLGIAGCLKYTGLYIVAAVLLSWLILQREHRGHRIMVATAAGMIVFDQIMLFFWWGHPYLFQTQLQIQRVLGIQSSGGTVTSPSALLHLLFQQYHVFIPSFLIALAGLAIVARYLYGSYRRRDWVPVQHQAVLFSWAAMGIVTLGLSNLRFPQYFALVLVPLYLLVWTEAWNLRRSFRWWLAGAATAAGLASFWLSTNDQSVNPLEKVQQYAAAHIPIKAEVVADEQVGDLLRQPYCREQQADACLRRAAYAITWNTYLQKTAQLGDSAFKVEMEGARRLWSSGGFNGTATVWKLDQPKPGPVLGIDVEADRSYSVAKAREYGRRLAAYIRNGLHANTMGIVWDFCDPSFTSGNVGNCQQTLSVPALKAIANAARAYGLNVQLRPLVRVGPPSIWGNPHLSWEGFINPTHQKVWFRNLLRAETPYLKLLRSYPESRAVVATEPWTIADSPQWQWLLGKTHGVCHCATSIASQIARYRAGVLPSRKAPGVDWYAHFHIPDSASQTTVTAAWEQSMHMVPRRLLKHTTLDEEGIRGTAGAYAHPESWAISGPADPTVQARWFTGACQTVKHFHMKGIYFYVIPFNDDPAHPSSFPAYFVNNAGSAAIRGCAAIFGER
jgi:4-amino-4-deoxy-L-arabinose transferase-like glycosyltransferase